jgi:hypothetical protein
LQPLARSICSLKLEAAEVDYFVELRHGGSGTDGSSSVVERVAMLRLFHGTRQLEDADVADVLRLAEEGRPAPPQTRRHPTTDTKH